MKKYLLLLISILFITFTLIGNCAWLSGYDQRIKLTIDNTKVDAALSDFPVTVFFTLIQGEEIFTEFDADSDYMKCAFTSNDGTTQLYAEKELFTINASSQYPPAQSDTYVKSTTKFDTNYWAYYATDPTKSLTGSHTTNSWLSASGSNTNQRFHIDLGSAKIVKKIYYENFHGTGSLTDRGVQNFTFWGSNTGAGTFDDLVYANDEGWTQLTISQSTFDQHTASDVADPKYITVTNSTAYRYYAFKFADNYTSATYIGVRRIELQAGEVIYHVKVPSVASGADTDIYYYYDNDHADNTTYIGAINTTAGGHVWDSNFKAVYHMVDATTSTVVDSTSNNYDLTKKGANEPIEAIGKVGQGQDFDKTDDYLRNGTTLDYSTMTHEFITKITRADMNDYTAVLLDKADLTVGTNYGYYIWFADSDANPNKLGALWERGSNGGVKTISCTMDSFFNSDNPICVAITFDASVEAASEFFRNGAKQVLTATDWDPVGSHTASTIALAIGSRSVTNSSYVLDGTMDEIRISDSVRTDAWIKATYNSLWDSLLTYGSEETGEEDNAIFFGTNF